MEDEKLITKSVRVEYITTKTDKFSNDLSYFKLKEKILILSLQFL